MPAWPTTTIELVAYLQAHPAVMCHYVDGDEGELRTFVELQYQDSAQPQINWRIPENGARRSCSFREDGILFDAAGFSPGPAPRALRYNYVDPPWLSQPPAAAAYPTTIPELAAYLTAHPQAWLVDRDTELLERNFASLSPSNRHSVYGDRWELVWLAEGAGRAQLSLYADAIQFDALGFTDTSPGVHIRYLYSNPQLASQSLSTPQAAVVSTYPRTIAELETYLQAHPRVGCELIGISEGVRTFQELVPTSVAGMFRINWLDEAGDQAHCFISADTASFDAEGVSVGDGATLGDTPTVRYTYRPGPVTQPAPAPVTVPVASTHFSQMQLINQLRHDWNEKCAELTAAQIAAEHMQRQLDEVKAERDALRAVTAKDVWYWQDDNSNYLESLTCRIVITADQLRQLLAERKPPVVSSHIIRRLR